MIQLIRAVANAALAASVPYTHQKEGVYLFFQDGRLTYVGETNNYRNRFRQHRAHASPIKIRVIPHASPGIRLVLEAALIYCKNPVHNLKGRPRKKLPKA